MSLYTNQAAVFAAKVDMRACEAMACVWQRASAELSYMAMEWQRAAHYQMRSYTAGLQDCEESAAFLQQEARAASDLAMKYLLYAVEFRRKRE